MFQYAASKFLFRCNELLAIAVKYKDFNNKQYILFERLDFLSYEIKNWLWKNSKVSILGNWLDDEEREEDSTAWKPYDCLNNVLWQGRDENSDK